MKYPDSFLQKLQTSHIQKKYARITTLTWNEEPIKEIEGLVTSGNCNLDGNSAIRTTISLSMISEDMTITKYSVALKTKVKIEIGLENNIDNQYPPIIWFQQGIFIVINFNTSISINQNNISITGKDKGCLLNGEISGSIPVSTDFGKVDDYVNSYVPIINFNYEPAKYYIKRENKYILDYSTSKIFDEQYYEKISSITTTKLPIKEIIRNMVHVYGHEPWHKIIINDLDLQGSQLLEYRGNSPLYLIKEVNTNKNMFIGITFDSSFTIGGVQVGSLENDQYLSLSDIDSTINNNVITLEQDGHYYQIIRLTYGDTMGYKSTELVYPGELIASVNETIVSILDKIKTVSGNYEYFYDVSGNFVFQAKHTYENVNFSKISPTEDQDILIDGSFYNNSFIWSFSDEETGTQISHTPVIVDLKNDFSIWGEKQEASGAKIPIHLRYGIQKKPIKYTTFDNITYIASDDEVQLDNNIEIAEMANYPQYILPAAYNALQTYMINKSDIQNNLKNLEDIYNQEIRKQKILFTNLLKEKTKEMQLNPSQAVLATIPKR